MDVGGGEGVNVGTLVAVAVGDGVIVGTACVRAIGGSESPVETAGEFARGFSAGLKDGNYS